MPRTNAEELFHAFLVQMVRSGAISGDDVQSVATQFDHLARSSLGDERRERYEQLAHEARCLLLHGASEPIGEFRAKQARRNLRVIDNEPTDAA